MMWPMVRTGGRASALKRMLEAGGLSVNATKKPAPRLDHLEKSARDDVLSLYRDLGGALERPAFKPGA
jgi:hypothetical protein